MADEALVASKIDSVLVHIRPIDSHEKEEATPIEAEIDRVARDGGIDACIDNGFGSERSETPLVLLRGGAAGRVCESVDYRCIDHVDRSPKYVDKCDHVIRIFHRFPTRTVTKSDSLTVALRRPAVLRGNRFLASNQV